MHAQVRRYQAPDEYAFFPDALPEPFLPPLTYPVLLHPNTVNLNQKLKHSYIHHILPAACSPCTADGGELRENYGSTAVSDVACLQALSRRIHFGKFVAEAKFREDPQHFAAMIRARDLGALEKAITNEAVEVQVLKRLELKARTYGTDPIEDDKKGNAAAPKINVEAVVGMYRDYVGACRFHIEGLRLTRCRLSHKRKKSRSSTCFSALTRWMRQTMCRCVIDVGRLVSEAWFNCCCPGLNDGSPKNLNE